MSAPQNYKNHGRFDPLFHFFVLPMLLVNVIFSIYATIHHWPNHQHLFIWWVVMSLVLFVLAGKTRGYALKVQDRIIRLEERLRLAAVLPPAELARAADLTQSQLIGLRFASDVELPLLVNRALAEKLDRKQIKEAISSWRADNDRV